MSLGEIKKSINILHYIWTQIRQYSVVIYISLFEYNFVFLDTAVPQKYFKGKIQYLMS